jgi:hypothetical protein
MALLCMRGKFTVTDPGSVRSLKLSAEFRGGMVVYLNGEEVGRRHMAPGGKGFEALAEQYPVEAYASRDKDSDKAVAALRYRRLEALPLPLEKLRKGLNVLALAIHRAPVPTNLPPKASAEWSTVGLIDIRLAAGGSGAASNTSRPKGLQVWNAEALEPIYTRDYGDPNEPLRPIRIVGCAGGAFSGQAVVSSDAAIKGLAAQMSDLKNKDGKGAIAAANVRVLYPRPGAQVDRFRALPARKTSGFDPLEDAPPAEIPGPDAVQPVWLKIRVPRDAAPGDYAGQLSVKTAAGTQTVGVELKVHGYRLPEPGEFRTWLDLVQSPESLALHYGAPLWSEKNFQLVGESFALLSEVGNKTLYIPVIAKTNLGNSESMVRWVKDGNGYRHDFSLVEKYLDLALARGLRPRVVCFQVWDYHLGTDRGGRRPGLGAPDNDFSGHGGVSNRIGSWPAPVSLFNPGTGQAEEMLGPKYDDPAALAFWKPVAEGIQRLMKKRGLEKSTMLGLIADSPPSKEVVDLWKNLLPDVPWVLKAHFGVDNLYGAPVGFRTTVIRTKFAVDPAIRRDYGWKQNRPIVHYPRALWCGQGFYRWIFEYNIMGGQRGVGHLPADFRPPKGHTIVGRYPESSWGSMNLQGQASWLAPGPSGPIPTIRFEMAREGIQECEARIFIEEALLDGKLGGALAQKCQTVLDERSRHVLWAPDIYAMTSQVSIILPGGSLGLEWYENGSRWRDDADTLFAAAAEVAKVLDKK